MWLIDQLAEARIQEAMERGELDDLPGRGRPVVLDDDTLVPEALRAGYRLLKNAGFLPREVTLLREIKDVEALLRHTADPGERTRGQRRLGVLRSRLDAWGGRGRDSGSAHGYLDQLTSRFDQSHLATDDEP